MNIIEEIIAIRNEKVKAGENSPKTIELTAEQKVRLKKWCDSTMTVIESPKGQMKTVPGLRYEEGIIYGMRYEP